MEISKGAKKAVVGALLFLVLGLSAFGGFGAHQDSAVGGVPAAHACCAPPPDYDPPPDPDAPTPTPTPIP